MLILQRKRGETLLIGEDISITVASVDGERVRLAISAPPEVSILRSELVAARAANRDSAKEESDPKALLALLALLDGMTEHGALFMKPNGETEKEGSV